jgi:hypothetical protein
MGDKETPNEDDVLRRMLATKPTPHKPLSKASLAGPKRRQGGLVEKPD